MGDQQYLAFLNGMNDSFQLNNQLVDQKNAVLQAAMGNPVDPKVFAKLPQDIQNVIGGGNRDSMLLQAQVLNDNIVKKNASTAADIQFLTSGYENSVARMDAQKQQAFDNFVRLASTFVDSSTGKVDVARAQKAFQEWYPGVDMSGLFAQLQGQVPISEYNKQFSGGINMAALSSEGNNELGSALSASIAKQEGGNYTSVNPTSGALGKYQIMPIHLPDINDPTTNKPLDPNNPQDVQTFLNNPQLQDQLYNKILGQLDTQYGGNTDQIIAAYYGGPDAAKIVGTPAADKPQKDGYPSINQYVQQVKSRMMPVIPKLSEGATPAEIDAALTGGPPLIISGKKVTQSTLYNGAMFSLLGVPNVENPLVGGLGTGARIPVASKANDIMTAYGITPFEAAAAAQDFKALSQANVKIVNQATFTKAFTATATDNLNLALALEPKVVQGDMKIVNKYAQWEQGNFTPAGPLAELETYVYTASREYAKVTSGGVGSVQALTDSAQAQADKLLNAAQSPAAFAATAQAMKNDMANVNNNYGNQISAFSPNITNLLGLASGGTESPGMGFGGMSVDTTTPGGDTTNSDAMFDDLYKQYAQ
jgi:predicted nucleic acid-binding Zn ribbon protein